MPYRIDLRDIGPREAADALDRLVELGALDIESIDGGIAAIMPDSILGVNVAGALGVDDTRVRVTPARGRDNDSVWVLNPRPVRAGRLRIVPAEWPPQTGAGAGAAAEAEAEAGALRMIDSPAFGTGLHPTTALCLEALDDELTAWDPDSVLDVGTGSGVLALAALRWGAPRAVAIDIDGEAVRAAAENARLNGLSSRLHLVHGGPEALSASWPLVLANVLAAPLMEMAPMLAWRVRRGGRLVLSGIRSSLASDVEQAYRHVGMRQVLTHARDGWSALILNAR
jgi:ribosomal protein L11 methyltransferase